jgi:LysR family transcriptional regulator, glycine cleavage system transcriptional activator
MPRRLPPLNALKAFEAAARHESFTRAAEELCVTQGAVSHQVKALEAGLGLKLFNRERQRLIITDAGRAYLPVVRDAFDRIASGTERLLQRQSRGALTVSTSPNFAAKWLVHRLGRFAEAHPDIELRVSASAQHIDFAREDIDLAIRHGDGTAPGLHVTRLCAETVFPVCSPKLLTGRGALRTPADLRRFPLLHVEERQAWSQWSQWLEFAGLGQMSSPRGPILSQASMAIDAAVDGQGVALARTALAAWDLIGGRLVRPFDLELPVPFAYWIVCPKPSAKLAKIAAFTDWLIAEASADARQLEEVKFNTNGRKASSSRTSPQSRVGASVSHAGKLPARCPARGAAPPRA